MVAAKDKPLIVIVGETASGKSSLALFLAKKFDGEIINADSWSVYEGFDIGTSKPNKMEQSIIKHHLLDVAKPEVGFSAAVFKKMAQEKIKEINNKNKIPFLVGGSGLYIDSVIYDYSFLPATSNELRQKYNSMSLDELKAEIDKKKYDTSGIDMRNKRRLIRLLENKGARPKSNQINPNTLMIGLNVDQELLESNIELRVNEMLNMGLTNEVEGLYKKYGWDIEPMKGIGYREFKKYFEGSQTLEETKKLIILDSIKLARKQRTWFKRNNSIQWANERSKIVTLVTTHLNKNSEY